MAPKVPPISKVSNEDISTGTTDHLAVIMWSSGLAANQRNIDRIRRCLSLFRRLKYVSGETVIARDSVPEYVFLVVSGTCYSCGSPLGPGSWFGLDAVLHGTPEPSCIKVSSDFAVLLRISAADFVQRLPSELSTNLRSRVRGVCRFRDVANTKAVYVHSPMLTARRDPGCIATARLVSLDLLTVATSPDTVREQISTSRNKLNDLIDSTA